MIAREQRRLRKAFTAIVCAVAPTAAAMQACSQDSTFITDGGAPEAASSSDATTVDVAEASPSSPDARAEDAACGYALEVLDAGSVNDADGGFDPLCRYTLPCGLPSTVTLVGCEIYPKGPDGGPQSSPVLGCRLDDGFGCTADAASATESGAVRFTCLDCLSGSGRRPGGLVAARAVRARDALGAHFARASHDEAASITAFTRLAGELARHGAPEELVCAALRAARDEARHARTMSREAHARGAEVPRVRVRSPRSPRSLERIARENAVEGCVLETMGALVARWQAAHASDASVRRIYARIATDELRHAALSWAVARWAEDRLNAAARARVARAKAKAVDSLRAIADRRAAPHEARLGLPSREQALSLLAQAEHLWAEPSRRAPVKDAATRPRRPRLARASSRT